MTDDSHTTDGGAPWHQEIVLPVLLGAARKTYGSAIRDALTEVGCDDVPRLGARVLGALARDSGVSDIAELCGISKQAASQLVDTLVTRDYLTRATDEQDRRRVNLRLTPRGQEAAIVIAEAVQQVDAAITARVGAERLAQAREVVALVVEMGHRDHIGARPAPTARS
jgi:DNA-binding MarR family transcriptional regulator